MNSIKTNLNETENKKTILHIFNSKYSLDKKKIDNIPVGLFGDLYSHELSFCLINNNDHKNLNVSFLLKNLIWLYVLPLRHHHISTVLHLTLDQNY